MLDDAFAHLEGEVQAAKGGVALLEVLHDAQGVQVVIEEKPVGAHGGVESFLSGVAEWRMAEIMHQRQRLDQIDIQAERAGDGARNLRDLDGVG